MKYQVEILPQALEDIESAYRWMADVLGAQSAEDWYDELMVAVQSLEKFPNRCPIAPEAVEFKQSIRQLLVGKRKGYRVMFVVERGMVFILYVRHTSRPWLTDAIDEAESGDGFD
jgi:plasmid stabilization system protein ParE